MKNNFIPALYSIFGKFALSKYSTVTVTAYTFLFASVISVPFADFGGICATMTGNTAFLLVMFALLSGLVPYLLYTYGLSGMQAGKAAVIACIEPVTAAIAVTAVLGEDMTITTVFGIMFVLGAVMLLQRAAE